MNTENILNVSKNVDFTMYTKIRILIIACHSSLQNFEGFLKLFYTSETMVVMYSNFLVKCTRIVSNKGLTTSIS